MLTVESDADDLRCYERRKTQIYYYCYFIKASKDICFRVNSEKTKYRPMIISRQQKIVQSQNMVIGNLSNENVEKLKYLGVMVTNTNDIREEIKHGKCMLLLS